MASFKQLRMDGVIKRADAEKIRYEDIHIEPGFNLPGRNEADDEDDAALLHHIMEGGMLPNLEVRPRDDGGVWLVDGHRRYIQMGHADAAGAPLRDKDGVLWVSVVQFVGNDVARTVRLLTSNANKQATPLQVAEVYARLERFKLSPDEIAATVGKTRQHVDQMLILAHANRDVHQLVDEGKVSATVAVDMVRKHGENAGAFIVAAGDKTGGKVTAKTVKPWSPPAKIVAPVLDAVELLIDSIGFDDRLSMENPGGDPSKMVMVSSAALQALIVNQHALRELGEAAEQKALAKAEKAKQLSIEGA